MNNTLNWRFSYFTQGLLECDPKWAKVRRYISLFALFAYIWVSNLLFGLDNALDWAETLQDTIPSFALFPAQFIALPFVLFLPVAGLGFLFVPVAVFMLVLYYSGKYSKEYLSLNSNREGMHYILASIYGYKYPQLEIDPNRDNNEIVKQEDSGNWLLNGYGPGNLAIRQGNIVLLERLNAPSRILPAGSHYLKRIEKIKQVIDIKDQSVKIPEFQLMTRDRVMISLSEFNVWYRIMSSVRDELRTSKSLDDRFVYSIDAVRSLSYNNLIAENGPKSWENTVRDFCLQFLSNYINNHTYAELTGIDRREHIRTIQTILDTPSARTTFREIGTKIIRHDYIDIMIAGDFEEDPRLKKWEEEWRGKAEKTRVEGESKKLAYQEFGLPEIHADILNQLAGVLEGVDLDDQSEENTFYILKRVAEVVDPTWISSVKAKQISQRIIFDVVGKEQL